MRRDDLIPAMQSLRLFFLLAIITSHSLGQSATIPAISKDGQVAPARPAASDAAAAEQPGSITGTVIDKDGAVIPKAKVLLWRPGSTQQAITDASGSFTFDNVPPGSFELTISAEGFATQKQSGLLHSGQDYVNPDVQLVVAATVDVEVLEQPEEIAEDQIHAEEKQRLLSVFPNYYVSYVPNPVPLTPKQKFELGWKSVVDPVSIGLAGMVAGFEQATDAYNGFGQGAEGYAKRFGASYADVVSGTFIGSVMLPTVFRQDPRYLYKGTGTRKSRLLYAVASAVICRGDNRRWQPNYSNMLGDLAAGALSNLYYPAANRKGVTLTLQNGLLGIGGSALSGVFEEFFSRKLTPHTPSTASSAH
jgi:Carboxypeptidase regulatory-like domain